MRRDYFVTGTDTEVGKTYASCALLHAFRRAGIAAVGMKPVAAGTGADGVNEDVAALAAASAVAAPTALVNPFCYADPIAPHIAAAETGRPIAAAPVQAALTGLQALAETVVVEGVGGFLVPLGDEFDGGDLAQALALPVILVVGMRLGCLNHALLTQEAIRARGLRLAGWIANRVDADMLRFAANLEALQRRIAAPLLGVLPYAPGDAAGASAALTLPG